MQVGAPHPVHQHVERAQHQVDTVLRAHDPEVDGEVAAAAAQLRPAPHGPHPAGVRAAADHRDVRRPPAAAGERDLPVRLVGGHHVVRGPVGPPLQPEQRRVLRLGRHPGRLAEAGPEHLRVEVVLVVDEADAAAAVEQRQRPVGVRRVAGLQDVEAVPLPGLAGQAGGPQPGVAELPEVAEEPGGRRGRRVLVEPDPVELRVRRVARSLGTDHRDPVARLDQRLALQPDAAVQRDRQVLHDDQDVPAGPAGLHCACLPLPISWSA